MRCPKCGSDNKEGRSFCTKCGSKLENVCPKCGFRNDPDDVFCGDCGAKLTEALPIPPRLEDMQKQLQDRIPQSLADKLFAGAKQMQGEYRLVTALFADVSGSSGMARELPLEQYVETMNDCFKMMVDTISIKYEGSINRFIGDCVLAFFGAPITHENDAERAILAALDIREGVKELGLDVSTGINTGMTYVGEMGSDLTYSERSAWGPDVDFARRLQEAAGPGQIWVGASTYRLTRRAFDFNKTVEIEAKGAKGNAYPVLHVKEHPEKLRGIEGLRARMIGREREFSDLKEAADGLISGRGCIVTIIGEAGLGKSRLAYELKQYLDKRLETSDIRQEDDDTTSLKSDVSGLKSHVSGLVSVLEGRSISIGQTVSYWPFLDILRTYLDLRDTDSESDIARKLREAITDLFPQGWEDVLPFMGRLLSVNLGDDMERKLSYYTPEQIRHQTLMRMRGVLTAISRRKPLLLILEDMHWSDDLSMDLVSLLMDDLAEKPLMLLCIYRPERGHRCWQLGDIASRKCLERYTEITLKKLSSAQSRQLVESLLEIENLPEATRDMILRKSEGNPFFIEEVIRYVIDRDLIYREDDRWKARREIEDIDVPDTIQSVLLSRVDRLEAETRYVLQCASVIGRLFRYRLLEHLSRHERDLEEHLSELEERELVIEERTVPELEYSFKHALTQEATYQSILERRRRQFHQRVAEGIEALYRDRVEDFYEELAHHYKLSGDEEKTIDYLLKSGIKAANNFANPDALKYLDQAEEILEKSNVEYREERVILHEKRGEILHVIGKWIESIRHYQKALEWCDDPHQRAGIYQKMGWLESEEMLGKPRAIEHLELGLRELPEDDRSVQRVRLEHDIAWVSGWRMAGEDIWGDSLLRLQQAAGIAEKEGYWRELAIIYVAIEAFQSRLGNYSDEYGQKAMEVAEELGDLPTLAWVSNVMGHTRWLLREGRRSLQDSISHFQRAIEISENINDVQMQARAWSQLGRTYMDSGQNEQAIESLESALDMVTGIRSIDPLLYTRRIMPLYADSGRPDMVISSFRRLMIAFDSLNIDEESQALALITGFQIMRQVYLEFRRSYGVFVGEEFPSSAQELLGELLKKVESRPQKAWYHEKLMNLYLELGDVDSAQRHAQEAVSIVDEMGRPDFMSTLYAPHLVLGEVPVANDMVYGILTRKLVNDSPDYILSEAEIKYRAAGQHEAFQQLCEELEHEDLIKEAGLNQLLLKPVSSVEGFPRIEFDDNFDSGSLMSCWEWIDPMGSSSYSLAGTHDRIEISPADRCLFGFYGFHGIPVLHLGAPRLRQYISGDFAIQTQIGGDGLGGLFVLKGNSIITFGRPISLGIKHNFELRNCDVVAARGFLKDEFPILRLERKGNTFLAYCSVDGSEWYSCGWTELEIEDPIQVGVYAEHPSWYKPQAVTSFNYFRIYRE